MSEDTPQIPTDAPAPAEAARFDAPPPGDGGSSSSSPIGGDMAQERPEVLVAGAFAGAFVFAKILKRLGGS